MLLSFETLSRTCNAMCSFAITARASKLRKHLTPVPTKSLSSFGEYILLADNHFVAIRVDENGCEINFTKQRHLWERAHLSTMEALCVLSLVTLVDNTAC